jgi:DNA-binding beta-propeller fold protein YncE
LVVSTGLAFGPSAAAASLPAGSYLVVGGDNGSMSFIDRASGSNVAHVPIDGTAFPVAVGSGNRTVFSNSINGIAVVDPSTLTVTTTLAKPGQGDAPYSTFALSGDRTTLVAANRTGSVIDVYDALNLTLQQSVTFAQGGNPSLAVSADGSLLYIAPDGSPVVSVIDLAAGTVKSTITVPNQVVDLELGGVEVVEGVEVVAEVVEVVDGLGDGLGGGVGLVVVVVVVVVVVEGSGPGVTGGS